MKTLITARFDKNFTDLLETITKDYEFAGYGVTGIKMPVPEMKQKIQGVELLISEFEDITREVIEAADKLKRESRYSALRAEMQSPWRSIPSRCSCAYPRIFP